MKIKSLFIVLLILCGCSAPKYSDQTHQISPEKKNSVQEILKIENYYGTCTLKYDEVYLMPTPSFSSDKISSIKKGQAVFSLGKETESWVFIQTLNGTTGWVGKSWINCSDLETVYDTVSFKKTISLAEQGHSAAQFLVCKAFDDGEIVPRNVDKAFSFCTLAAEQGHTEAQFFLGSMYELGEGVKQSFEASAHWYRQAAEGGFAQAQYNLGVYYYDDKGVPKDHSKMLFWWEKAAAQGHDDAQEWLDVIYPRMLEQGSKAFDERNFEWAFSLLEIVAEKGFAEAQVKLGQMYARGDYVSQDDIRAVDWFSRAASQKNPLGLVLLGNMFMNGRGVQKDFDKGLNLIYLAAAQGNNEAKTIVEKSISGYKLVSTRSTDGEELNAALFLVSEPNTDQDGKKWYWLKTLFLLEGKVNKLDLSVKELSSYNVDDCFRGLTGVKQIQNYVTPNNEIEMKPLHPSSTVHEFVCGIQDQQTPRQQNNKVSTGTGWLMDNGYIVTNFHVIDGHSKISLINENNEEFQASVVSKDTKNDLVLLKIHASTSTLVGLPLAEEPCRAGDEVFAVGYPHPDFMGKEAKVTSGIVSSSKGMNDDPRMLQISVPVQAGNSGGPLINSMGEVVGIVTLKLSAVKVFDKTGDLPQNVNYAIKVNYLESLSEGVKKLSTRILISTDLPL